MAIAASSHAFWSCRYARAWPDLFDELPDAETKRSVSATLANGRLEGYEPSREAVANVIDAALGRVSYEEYMARVSDRLRDRAE